METEVVKAFNAELVSLYELRPPISKKKIVDITKAAMKAIKYYKHVVFGVEKFLTKCKAEYKIPGLYCIDSIIRQSRHQFKDKDVFGPRFSLNMQTTLSNLLNCKAEDKLKVVRVLNLWKSHEIFDASKLRPWLEYCKDVHGLETDFVVVEKSVKGEHADFSIYSRIPGRGEKQKAAEPQSPPPENRSRTPPLPIREPSDDAVEGGVSERETLAMLTTMGLDLSGMFSSDPSLLQKVSKLVNDKLVERRELDSKRQGNIKNLLSREFDYSDEDDSGDDEFNRKLETEVKHTELTKQQIIGMAEAVLREPDTKEEIQRMHTERISALSQAAAARVQAVKQQQPSSAFSTAHPLGTQTGTPITIPLNPISATQTNVTPVPPVSIPMPSQPLQPQSSSSMLSPRSAQQLLLTNSGIPAFTPNMPPPSILSMLPPQIPTSVPSTIPIPDSERERNDVDKDDRYRRGDDRLDADRDERIRRDRFRNDRGAEKVEKDRERRRGRSRDHEHERVRGSSRGFTDGRQPKRPRRSRSNDRSFGSGRREHRRSNSRGRRGTSRSRVDRERSERSRDNSAYRDVERQRRKMGLPWPPKEGYLLIASCTLWLGRIPSNCTEIDIRQAVAEAGEPARISIIHSRACAYVTMKDRKAAFRVMDRMQGSFKISEKNVKLNWGIGQGLKSEKYADCWDPDRGYSMIPYSKLPDDLEPLIEGGHLEVESLPPHLANLYDERGLIGKHRDPEPTSLQSTSHIQLPQMAPNMPPFQFPLSQPPRLPGAAPFLPHGMVPIPSIFPPGLPPPIGNMPRASGAGGSKLPDSAPGDGNATNATSAPQQAMGSGANVERMRLQGSNAFISSSYNIPPPRYPNNAPLGMRMSRSAMYQGRTPFSPFHGGPPFGGAPMLRAPPPLMRTTGMGKGPRYPFPPRHFSSNISANNYDAHIDLQDGRWRNDESKEAQFANPRHDEWDRNSMVPSSSHEECEQPESSQAEKSVTDSATADDSSNELVTSTTHDDESGTVSGTVETSAGETEIADGTSAVPNDDLKAVTMTEDRMLEQAIVYGDSEDFDE